MRGRSARGGDDPERHRRVQPHRVGGRQVARDHDAGRLELGSREREAEETREHLPSDAPQIGRPRAEVLVLEPIPLRRRPFDHVVPGLRGRPVAVRDRVDGGREERIVLQEEQVRVEDLGLVRARHPGDVRSLACGLVADVRERGVERGALGVGARPRSFWDRQVGRPEPPGGTESRHPARRDVRARSPRRPARRVRVWRLAFRRRALRSAPAGRRSRAPPGRGSRPAPRTFAAHWP